MYKGPRREDLETRAPSLRKLPLRERQHPPESQALGAAGTSAMGTESPTRR